MQGLLWEVVPVFVVGHFHHQTSAARTTWVALDASGQQWAAEASLSAGMQRLPAAGALVRCLCMRQKCICRASGPGRVIPCRSAELPMLCLSGKAHRKSVCRRPDG